MSLSLVFILVYFLHILGDTTASSVAIDKGNIQHRILDVGQVDLQMKQNEQELSFKDFLLHRYGPHLNRSDILRPREFCNT